MWNWVRNLTNSAIERYEAVKKDAIVRVKGITLSTLFNISLALSSPFLMSTTCQDKEDPTPDVEILNNLWKKTAEIIENWREARVEKTIPQVMPALIPQITEQIRIDFQQDDEKIRNSIYLPKDTDLIPNNWVNKWPNDWFKKFWIWYDNIMTDYYELVKDWNIPDYETIRSDARLKVEALISQVLYADVAEELEWE